MKPRTVLRAGLAVLLVSLPCAALAQGDDVQQLAAQWTNAYNTHDRQALSALYTEDARLMMHGAPTYVGRENIGKFWTEDFKEGEPLTLLTVTHSIDGVDMILVHGNYLVVDRKKGDLLGAGRFAHIWTKGADGKWLLDRDLWLEPFEPYSR